MLINAPMSSSQVAAEARVVVALYSPRSPRRNEDMPDGVGMVDANMMMNGVQLTPRSEDDAFLHSPRSPFSSANTTPHTTPR